MKTVEELTFGQQIADRHHTVACVSAFSKVTYSAQSQQFYVQTSPTNIGEQTED
jgi:hypothetical protein